MAITAEEINVIVTAKVDKALKGLKDTQKASSKTASVFKDMAKSIAGPLAAGVIVGAFIKISKAAATAASDAEEISGKFNTVFKSMALDANLAANSLATDFGLAGSTAQKLLSDTGDLLTGFGLTTEAALDLSDQTNRLAIDLASFTNAQGGAEAVSRALTSAYAGERESLKTYGIVIKETDLQARLLQDAQKGLIFENENAAKAYATLALATEQSKNSLGDYERTQESTANVTRRLNEQVKESSELYGTLVNDALTPLKKALADELTGINQTIAAHILKKKVIAGEGTAIEILINKQNELSVAENLLNESQEAVLKTEKQILENKKLNNRFADDESRSLEVTLENSRLILTARENEVEVLTRQKTAVLLLVGEEKNQIAAALSLAQAIKEKAEAERLATEEARLAAEAIAESTLTSSQAILALYEYRDAYINVQGAYGELKTDIVEGNKEIKDSNDELWAAFASSALGALSAVDSFADATAAAELQRLEESGASEEVIAAKKRQIANEDAKRKKALGLLSVGIDTASAIIGFLANPGGIPGVALSVLAGITGATQAAAIAATPIPALAEGGSFTTSGPQTMLVGDNPGGIEKVTVEPVSSAGANEAPAGGGGGGGSYTLMIDGEQFNAFLQRKIDNRNIVSSAGGAI